jgi:hypothetical protein
MIETQSSQLLPALFTHFDPQQRLHVLHLGPAMPETLDFFSGYRCKLFFVDLFAVLPLVAEEGGPDLVQQFQGLLDFPEGTQFDICLCWDLLNFLDALAISALQEVLLPFLHRQSRIHCFAVHNPRVRPADRTYAIRQQNEFVVRERVEKLPGYTGYGQGQLKDLLSGFKFERTVLRSDKRLEMLLNIKS